jgi:O-glycosyl hydrolase
VGGAVTRVSGDSDMAREASADILGWRRAFAALALGVLGALAVSAAPASATTSHSVTGRTTTTPAVKTRVATDPTYRAVVDAKAGQTIDGFGASGAWWPTDVYHFGPAAQRQLGGLLFSRSGLALSQYRYNIGGGGVGVKDPYKAPPSFINAAGKYNWDADPAGLDFLKLAAAYHVPQLIGFVNSAPPQFTTDHLSCHGRLAPDEIAAFAAYLTAVVSHLQQADHIALSDLSPMNEPDTTQPTCRQEGMAVPVSERAALVTTLAADLATTAAHPGVIADESSLVSQLLDESPGWLADAGSAAAVVAHHGYDYPSAAELGKVASIPSRHWNTEICCFNGKGFGWQYDPTMTNGLWLADTIWSDLSLAGDSAFDWWVAASPNLGCDPMQVSGCQNQVNLAGRNDGLVYFDPYWSLDGNQTFYLTKRYWVMAAFSRYVRPGAVLHSVSGLPAGLRAVAFQRGSNWVVEVINDRPVKDADIHLRLPGSSDKAITALVTDADRNLAPLPLGGTTAEPLVTAPPASVTTILYSTGITHNRRSRPRASSRS